MSTQHTPGQWFYDGSEIYAEGGKTIALLSRYATKADGVLIASAPELVEVLEALCQQEDWEGEYINPVSPIGRARAILAKVKGME